MVLITETLSLTDLVIRAAAFLAQLPEKWYKGDSQIKTSKVHLKVLSQKTAQWERQLKHDGMNDHPVLGDLLAETVKLLDAEEDKYEKRRNDRFWKLKRRVFPSRLTYLLATLRGFVEAGPQIMESSVETSKLLTRLSLREPLPLPFGDDPKYVPLQTVVDEVQSALEDAGGPQVVTLYGEPGAGKSSLAKHVALLYWDSIRGSTPCMFDGVQYIFCGRGCSADIRRLRREILSNVGLGGIGDANDGRQGEDESLSSHQSVLRRLLGNRRLLIILDDVWREDFNALTNLISRGVRSRYLITSQTRDVWFDARQIKMPQPTIAQALSILKSHAQGFPTDEQLQLIPRGFEGTVDEIISKLQCHPLSLVNVAVSMPASGGKDLSRWKSLAQNIFQFLDENSYSSRVLVNERPYSLGVSASIMLMVDCLPSTAERDLLFLIFMLHGESGQGVSQHLVRFFLRRCYHGNSSVFTFKYFSARQYLEDNSLVQVHRSEGDPGSMEDSAMLTIHSLRRRYIRQKHLPAVQNLAFGLLAGCDGRHDGSLLVYPNSEQSLAVALGTVYFDKSLMAEVAAPFQNVMSLMNKSEIPRNLEQRIDARELVESVRKKLFVIACDYIIPLLNLEGEEVWKQRARADASKLVMKRVCMGKTDDESMASLLAIPHVRAASLAILRNLHVREWSYNFEESYYGGRDSFSDMYSVAGMSFLSTLTSSLTFSSKLFRWPYSGDLSECIVYILGSESERRIQTEFEKLRKFVNESRDPAAQDTIVHAFLGLHRSRLTAEMLNGYDLQQYLPAIIWQAIDGFESLRPAKYRCGPSFGDTFEMAMDCVRRDKGYVNILLTFPIPLEEQLTNISCFRRLLRLERTYGPNSLLGVLSATQEFKAKAAEILKREWCEEDFTLWPESDGDGIARFWGNVALLRDLHHTTRLRLVKIAERWMAELREYCSEVLCSCTCCDSDEWCSCCVKDSSCMSIKKLSLSLRERESCTCFRKRISDYRIQEITRTVTIISHLHSDSVIIPTIECSQQRRVTSRCRPCRSEALQFYTEACMGRAFAYYQMEMHAEAISFAHLAHRAYGSCDHDSLYAARRTCDTCNFDSKCVQVESRALMIFVKALSKDYQGAMESLDQVAHSLSDENERDDFWQFRLNADRAVLFRFSGEFSKAILNFNISMKHWEHMISSRSLKHSTILGENDNPRVLNFFKYRVLKHRGYAKYMMGDLDGSKLDTKSAEDIKLSKQMVEFVSRDRHSMFGFNRVGSLVQVGLDYSLLHFPVDNQLL